MKILITNDDGIDSDGLVAMEKIAMAISNSRESVFVVAPKSNQSAKSNSLTFNEPFKIEQITKQRYSVEGTPTDCVIFAMDHLMKEGKPDLLLSGINKGYNLSEDVFYSGTVGAAIEGSFRGVLSIAISQCYNSETMSQKNMFDFAEKNGADLCLKLYNNFNKHQSNEEVIFNVNFPVEPIKSYPKCIRSIPIGRRAVSNFVCNQKKQLENFITAEISSRKENDSIAIESDFLACLEGYITVSPINTNLNHEMLLKELDKVL